MPPCPTCGTENAAQARFCHGCGTTLALACPSCGAPYAVGHAFCEECGTALPGAAQPVPQTVALPAPEAPATERRLVSVLFADLVGSTALAESRDAEDTRELLNRYFDLARDVIERHGGL